MQTYDIIQITRTRLRYSVMAETMEEAKRLFLETGGELKEDETLDIHEQFVFERGRVEPVTGQWDAIEIEEAV